MELVTPDILTVECRRCGDCCRKGGPSLQISDAPLIKSGKLRYEDLYTIRAGELVYNNVEDEFITIDYELIKVADLMGERTCAFFKEDGAVCTIYDDRPAQCRAFECWNPNKLISAFAEEKLTRRHLIGDNKELSAIIESHDDRSSCYSIAEAFGKIQEGDEKSLHTVYDALQYDEDLRHLLMEKMSVPARFLPLLLGRPLADNLHMFGYKIELDGTTGRCITRL